MLPWTHRKQRQNALRAYQVLLPGAAGPSVLLLGGPTSQHAAVTCSLKRVNSATVSQASASTRNLSETTSRQSHATADCLCSCVRRRLLLWCLERAGSLSRSAMLAWVSYQERINQGQILHFCYSKSENTTTVDADRRSRRTRPSPRRLTCVTTSNLSRYVGLK